MQTEVSRSASFKVKSETKETHENMVKQFSDMLNTWKSNKEGRDFELVNNEEELALEITAKTSAVVDSRTILN